jgi:hypothetical protein
MMLRGEKPVLQHDHLGLGLGLALFGHLFQAGRNM